MLLQKFEAKGLSHYSYAVGDEKEGIIAIIDPERDINTYIGYAAKNNLKIKYILETHIHADFASGAKALADKTGAELILSAYDTGEKYEYSFPHTEAKDGDVIKIGSISLKVLHTPGHTPEHISFLLSNNNEPVALFSGDFLFIGSLGRPDLLGEDEKHALAEKLYNSVKVKLADLPDSVEVYPAHGAGSLCGAGMSTAASSDMKSERMYNPYLNPELTQEQFVAKILGSSPPFPQYYLRMKALNALGANSYDNLAQPKPMTVEDFADLDEGVIVDVRHPLTYGAAHIEDSLNFGSPEQLSTWAPWMLSYDAPVFLVGDSEEKIPDYVRSLARVGLDNVEGYLKPGMNGWVNKGNDFADTPQVSVHFVQDLLDAGEKVKIIDVRSESEWKEGHIKGATHIYLGDLPNKLDKLNPEDTIFCICGGGTRSSLAASLIQQEGFDFVYNVFGGMGAWKAAMLPVVEGK